MRADTTADSRTAERLLLLLKTAGPQTAGELAPRLGVTAMGARLHLYRFAAEGLVEFEDQRRPVGRPARIWRLTPAAAARFPERHGELTLELLDAIRAAFGRRGLDRLLRERTRRQLGGYRERVRAAGASLRRKVEALAQVRTEQGYMAQCSTRADGAIVLAENHCPIRAAACACPGFCREELELFRAALGRGVTVDRTDHIVAGARRCAYLIERRRPARSE